MYDLFFWDEGDNFLNTHALIIALLGTVILQNGTGGILHGREAGTGELVGINNHIHAPILELLFSNGIE